MYGVVSRYCDAIKASFWLAQIISLTETKVLEEKRYSSNTVAIPILHADFSSPASAHLRTVCPACGDHDNLTTPTQPTHCYPPVNTVLLVTLPQLALLPLLLYIHHTINVHFVPRKQLYTCPCGDREACMSLASLPGKL